MNKLNKKILVIFISLFLILNITCSYKIFAATTITTDGQNQTVTTTTTNANGDKSSSAKSTAGVVVGSDNDPDVPWEEPSEYLIVNNGCTFSGGALTYDLLCSHGDLLCSAHGVTLTSSSAPAYDSVQESSGSTYDASQVPDLTPVRTQPNFTASERKYGTPEEAFILAYAQHSDGAAYGEYTPAQLAWWQTAGGQAGTNGGSGMAAVSGINTNTTVAGINAYSNDLFQFTNTSFQAIGGVNESFATPNGISIQDTVLSQTVGKTIDKTKKYGNLRDSAREFQNYIIRAAGVSNVSEVERQSDGYFKLNYNPQWLDGKKKFEGTEYNYSNPTVAFDGENLTVGPFGIDYVYSEKFAYITGMYLETDDTEHPKLEYNKDWTITCKNKVGDYPNSNTPFYIVINNKYNATKITNFHVDFEYTNAKGGYNYFYGTIRETMTNRRETSEDIRDDQGNVIGTRTRIEWDIRVGTIPAQTLAGNIDAAITKFKTDLDREITLSSQIEVEKVIVDEKGEPIAVGENDFFDFKLEVDGAVNSDNQTSENIRVKGNNKATSKTYYWASNNTAQDDTLTAKEDNTASTDNNENVPTYKIKEINYPNGYEFVSIEPESGKLKAGETIKIIAKNKIQPKTGNLEIVKKAEVSPLGTSDLIEGKEFGFDITVNGKFKYNDGEYKEQSVTISAKVIADGNAHTVIANDVIKWYGDEAPTFDVQEVMIPEGVTQVSTTPNKGSFKAGGTVTVTAINKQDTEKGKFEIIKTLTDGEKVYSEEAAQKLEFNFKIKVGNNDEEQVKATFLEKKEDGTYVWKFTSKEYEWLKGHNPTYTIQEIDNPIGTAFDEEATKNANEAPITVENGIIKGTLKGNTEQTGIVTNNVINKLEGKKGTIDLTKKVADSALADKDFSFVVTVTGSFKYKGQYFENKTIQLTNATTNTNGYNEIESPEKYNNKEFVVINAAASNKDEANKVFGAGSYSSDEFEWYGEAPKYKVQENLVGEDINHTVEPSEGILTENTPVKVTAWNGHDKVGYLHIYKTLEDGIAEKLPSDYISNLVFTFKVKVDGYEEQTISLTAEYTNGKWIWEKTLKYSWSFDQSAPNYKIEEVNLPTGTSLVSIDKPEGQLKENAITDTEIILTKASVINKVEEHKADLKIVKEVSNDNLNGKDFKFKVTIKGVFSYNGKDYTENNPYTEEIIVKGGSSTILKDITWYGNKAPTYVVEELESDIAVLRSKTNDTGTLKCKICNGNAEDLNVAKFINDPKKTGGYLEITKQISAGNTIDETFYFEITIGSNKPYTIGLKANETYKSDYIEWYIADGAPQYTVTEINLPEGTEFDKMTTTNGTVNGQTATGTLIEKISVSVVAVNKLTERKGKFEVVKEIIPNKFIDAAVKYEFEIEIRISGTFKIDNVTHYAKDGDYVYTEKISVDVSKSNTATYTSPEITWWGNNAPTVTIEEINLPEGWRQVGSPSNNGAALKEDEPIRLVVTNELPVFLEMDLTIELAGEVWEDVPQDSGKNMKESVPNGKIDSSEDRIKGVEVYVYRVAIGNNSEISRTLAKVYGDNLNSETEFPMLTSEDGKWEAPRVEIVPLTDSEKSQGATAVKYDVEFVYDGQTYEPTLFLSKDEGDKYVEGSASEYINATTSQRDSFANKSMAKDFDRDVVNNRIQSVSGKTSIDGNGNTVGTVNGANSTNSVFYEANVKGTDATRVESKLITTDDNGVALDLFKTKARTSVGGLEYPFDNRTHLENYDIKLTDKGLVQKYIYSATYNYCLHINLGLIRRLDADVEASKDLYSAKVVVDGKGLDYTFNKLADIGKDSLNRQIEADRAHIEYELGLYKTDYYYRAEIYRTNSQVYSAVKQFYKSIGKTMEDSELEVYLTYRINLYNQSGNYVICINSVDDYFDSSFGAPIQTVTTKVVNGSEKVVAGKSYMSVNGNKSDVEWTVTDTNINGSDGIIYNKMTTNLNNVKLASGEKAEIFVTFAVKKSDIDGVKDAIELGNKSNIVEIASYSTYYADGTTIAGKIDRDSAPANINIRDYNIKPWYEDDTDAAPVLKLTTIDDNRAITGTAWEDKAQNDTAIGNGIRDDDEALIGGLTTELVEKITVGGIDYDFLWPTNKSLDCLGGKTLEYLTGGFTTTTETSRENKDSLSVGEYTFTNVPTGTYVVRFIYGNDKTKLEDTSKITLNGAEALKPDGSKYYENINTANYDEDLIGSTPAVYNGQDYKSTIYQSGFASMNEAGYVTNAWHDLSKSDLANAKVSDARDSEARRLEVIANSQTITNVNGNVLAKANDIEASHADLYKDYYMFADTAKLDLNLEAKDETGLAGVNAETVNGKVLSNGSVYVEKGVTNYTITNIDFGLIERPETALVLDKQISEIKLTTNDKKVIFDAMYDISYQKVDKNSINLRNNDKVIISELSDGYLVANITLNTASVGTDVLQALDKNEMKLTNIANKGTQNFRFVNVDEEILQGTTIEINYLITALNVSETDYTSKALYDATNVSTDRLTVKDAILTLAKNASDEAAKGTTEVGKYLGTNYYVGNGNTNGDVVVTSKVRQLVDYVDNDARFTTAYNEENDHMWRNTSITELTGNGFENNRLIDIKVIPGFDLVDENGISYIADQRNNLILSVDNQEDGVNSNKGFEKELVPYVYSESNSGNPAYSSQIRLTITKTVSAQDDADNLTYDNLAEIVKFENTVGRRDEVSIAGNANPKLGEFETAITERDESATELVTFTPPTGIETETTIIAQILIVTIVALGIVAIGIVIIKKSVLKK